MTAARAMRVQQGEQFTLPAYDHVNQGRLEVYIRRARVVQAKKRGQEAINLLHLVPQVLVKPSAIFKGLVRDGGENSLCYCGRPGAAYEGMNKVEPYSDQVFLVFLGSERFIYNWRWELADTQKAHLPEGALEGRFAEVLFDANHI